MSLNYYEDLSPLERNAILEQTYKKQMKILGPSPPRSNSKKQKKNKPSPSPPRDAAGPETRKYSPRQLHTNTNNNGRSAAALPPVRNSSRAVNGADDNYSSKGRHVLPALDASPLPKHEKPESEAAIRARERREAERAAYEEAKRKKKQEQEEAERLKREQEEMEKRKRQERERLLAQKIREENDRKAAEQAANLAKLEERRLQREEEERKRKEEIEKRRLAEEEEKRREQEERRRKEQEEREHKEKVHQQKEEFAQQRTQEEAEEQNLRKEILNEERNERDRFIDELKLNEKRIRLEDHQKSDFNDEETSNRTGLEKEEDDEFQKLLLHLNESNALENDRQFRVRYQTNEEETRLKIVQFEEDERQKFVMQELESKQACLDEIERKRLAAEEAENEKEMAEAQQKQQHQDQRNELFNTETTNRMSILTEESEVELTYAFMSSLEQAKEKEEARKQQEAAEAERKRLAEEQEKKRRKELAEKAIADAKAKAEAAEAERLRQEEEARLAVLREQALKEEKRRDEIRDFFKNKQKCARAHLMMPTDKKEYRDLMDFLHDFRAGQEGLSKDELAKAVDTIWPGNNLSEKNVLDRAFDFCEKGPGGGVKDVDELIATLQFSCYANNLQPLFEGVSVQGVGTVTKEEFGAVSDSFEFHSVENEWKAMFSYLEDKMEIELDSADGTVPFHLFVYWLSRNKPFFDVEVEEFEEEM